MTPTPTVTGTGTGVPAAPTRTQRTLERDIRIAAVVFVGCILTVLAWKVAREVTGSLAAAWSDRLFSLREPLFLASVVLIWAGAASFVARILGTGFRNVIFDRRNLTVAQGALIILAVFDAMYTARGYIPEETRGELGKYGLAIALLIGVLLVSGLQRIYGQPTSRGGRGEKGEGRTWPFLLFITAVLVAGVALSAWVFLNANRTPPHLYYYGRAEATPSSAQPAPAPAPAPRTWHGLRGGVEKTLTLNGEWSEKISLPPTHRIKWDRAPRNVEVRLNGMNVVSIWSGRRTNDIGTFEFRTRDSAVAVLKVATGIPAAAGN